MESFVVSISRFVADDTATWSISYPSHGQGIFTFNILRKTPFELRVCGDCISNSMWLSLHITNNRACFKLGGREERLLGEVCGEDVGYNPDTVTSYWFSLDCHNLVLKYGKGYFMEETTILSFDFLVGLNICEQIKKRSELRNIFDPHVKRILQFHNVFSKNDRALDFYEGESSCHERTRAQTMLDANKINQLASLEMEINSPVEFYPHPLVANWPFAVKESSEASLFEINSNDYILSGSLPVECQELYKNISSAKIDLDWSPPPHKNRLSEAIRYSLETEGKTLYEKLKSKQMKYIRVTLGPHRSNSPGIPYVLELWPKSMGSPVHCHGNSYGVIKVLHGGLRVEIYNRDMKTLIKCYNVQKGDVTWMSPHWYQSHRLFNDTADFSATIQCYRYGMADTKRWPYFDYVNEDGSHGEFLPNSDFTFTEMYETVLAEFNAIT